MILQLINNCFNVAQASTTFSHCQNPATRTQFCSMKQFWTDRSENADAI